MRYVLMGLTSSNVAIIPGISAHHLNRYHTSRFTKSRMKNRSRHFRETRQSDDVVVHNPVSLHIDHVASIQLPCY